MDKFGDRKLNVNRPKIKVASRLPSNSPEHEAQTFS